MENHINKNELENGKDHLGLIKEQKDLINNNGNLHAFNIENPELSYQDETLKLVNINKNKNSNDFQSYKNEDNYKKANQNEKDKYKKNVVYIDVFGFLYKNYLKMNKILDFGIYIFFAISVYLYILSLAGCHDTQTACLVNLNPQFFHKIVIFLSISSIINAIIIFLILKNSICRLHLLYIIFVFGYLTFYYDTGSDLAFHGAYNRMVFFLLIFISIIFIYFTNFLVYLIKKKYFKLISFCTISTVLTVIYISIKISDCSKWNLGLNNKNLFNDLKSEKDKCIITSPQKCWVDFLDGLFDVSWYLQEDCQNFRTGERTELLKYLPKRFENTFVFGYPISNVWRYIPESYHLPFFYNLMKNFIDIKNSLNDNKTNNYENNIPEIILSFDKKTQLGKIEINIHKNLTLVEERNHKAKQIKEERLNKINKENQDKNITMDQEKIELVDNVLFIYIDSISRQHFLRKMKNTIKFMEKYFKKINFSKLEEENLIDEKTLEKGEKINQTKDGQKAGNKISMNIHIDNNKNILNEDYSNKISKKNKTTKNQKEFNFYQFLKYHAFIYFTQPNVNPMFYGESMKHNNGTHIIKHFHDRGFISAQSNNICSRELYDIEPGFIENLKWEPFDHENIALFCDPNYFNPENPFTPYMGPYSIKKRCLYGRNTFEYVLDYGEKFWEVYLQEKKFLRLAFQDAHEGTGEVARYLDEYLFDFLNKLEQRNWLNNTAIFIVSDHGNNMIGFYNLFNCEDFIKEKTLATWFMLLPSKTFEKYDNLILENENIMVTPYDIFDTLISLIGGKDVIKVKSNLGQSVITEIIEGKTRNCKRYALDMLDIWCRCDEI